MVRWRANVAAVAVRLGLPGDEKWTGFEGEGGETTGWWCVLRIPLRSKRDGRPTGEEEEEEEGEGGY